MKEFYMKKSMALLVTVSTLAFASNASALEYTPYTGVDYVNSHVLGHNFKNADVVVGAKYNKNFSTEIFYQTPIEAKTWKESGDKIKSSFRSYGLDAYGYLPLGCDQVWSIIGTAGVAQMDLKDKDLDTVSVRENGWAYRVGTGVQYDINDAWSARVVARYSFLDKMGGIDNVMDVTAGVRYSF
jgi:opacity protein-like surface antigen